MLHQYQTFSADAASSTGVNSGKRQSKEIILLATGSHNPPHPGHLNMVLLAKKTLEAQGFTVSEAYVSPSHDSYIASKRYPDLNIKSKAFARPRLNADARIELLQSLIDELGVEDVKVHKAESKFFDRFYDHTQVAAWLQQQHPEKTVVYVAGDDLAKSCLTSLWWYQPGFNFVCVSRDTDLSAELDDLISRYARSPYIQFAQYVANPDETFGVSSTGVMSLDEAQLKLLPSSYLETLGKHLISSGVDNDYYERFLEIIGHIQEERAENTSARSYAL